MYQFVFVCNYIVARSDFFICPETRAPVRWSSGLVSHTCTLCGLIPAFNDFNRGTSSPGPIEMQPFHCTLYNAGLTESYKVKQHHSKVLLNSFTMNGHTLGFCP